MSEPTTSDAFLGGRLLLRQPARGHRAGTDAALLSAALPGTFAGACADLGAGIGAAGLALAVRAPAARVTLVESEAAIAALARANVEANGLAGRVDVLEADVTLAGRARVAAGLADRAYDAVITNPPFLEAGAARLSPSAYRVKAHVGDKDLLARWIRTAAAILVPGGVLVVIHRADALPRLLAECDGRFGSVEVLPVLPRRDQPATRILMRAIRGSRTPFRLLPPLVLHEGAGFTPEAAGLHNGEASLPWSG